MPQLDLTVWPILTPSIVVGFFVFYTILYTWAFNSLILEIKKFYYQLCEAALSTV